MIDPDKRLHDVNTAWGRGYVYAMIAPKDNPPWPPGATGDQWARGYYFSKHELVIHGAVDTREPQ